MKLNRKINPWKSNPTWSWWTREGTELWKTCSQGSSSKQMAAELCEVEPSWLHPKTRKDAENLGLLITLPSLFSSYVSVGWTGTKQSVQDLDFFFFPCGQKTNDLQESLQSWCWMEITSTLSLFFWDRVLCSLDCPWTCYVARVTLDLWFSSSLHKSASITGVITPDLCGLVRWNPGFRHARQTPPTEPRLQPYWYAFY